MSVAWFTNGSAKHFQWKQKGNTEKDFHSFTAWADLLYSGISFTTISQFHNHAQNIQAVVLVGHTSCKLAGLYDWGEILLKMYYNWYIYIIFYKIYSLIQKSAMFMGHVARQNNGVYVLRMIVKLAYRDQEACNFQLHFNYCTSVQLCNQVQTFSTLQTEISLETWEIFACRINFQVHFSKNCCYKVIAATWLHVLSSQYTVKRGCSGWPMLSWHIWAAINAQDVCPWCTKAGNNTQVKTVCWGSSGTYVCT